MSADIPAGHFDESPDDEIYLAAQNQPDFLALYDYYWQNRQLYDHPWWVKAAAWLLGVLLRPFR